MKCWVLFYGDNLKTIQYLETKITDTELKTKTLYSSIKAKLTRIEQIGIYLRNKLKLLFKTR